MKTAVCRFGLVSAVIVSGCFLQACQVTQEQGRAPKDPEVVAVYDGGSVTRKDVDVAILARPPEARIPESEDPVGWYRTVIEDIVIERILLADSEIDAEMIEEKLAGFRLEELHRQTVELFVEERLPEIHSITDDEVRSFFDKHQDQWTQKGRREVFNIFLREGGKNQDRGLKKTADEIRDRFGRGESFGVLAQKFSDSESRHQGGLVGWLEEAQLAPPLAGLVFSLDEGQMSEPIATPQGVHLFLVAGIVEPRESAFAEVRPQIEKRLKAERREALVDQLADTLPEVPYTFVAKGEDLQALMKNAVGKTPVLRVGTYGMDVGRLREMVFQAVSEGQPPSDDLPERILELIERRERIFIEASKLGLDRNPEIEQRLESALNTGRVNLRRQQVIERTVDGDVDQIQSWYEEHKMRFSTPLRLNATRLVVPLESGTAAQVMESLEALSRGEDSLGVLDLAADRFGGRVENVGWKTLAELAAIRPMAARLASNLEVGQISPPFRTTNTLEVLLVNERQEPEIQPFTAIYDRVRSEYLESNSAEVYGRWVGTAMDRNDVRIFPERMVEMVN